MLDIGWGRAACSRSPDRPEFGFTCAMLPIEEVNRERR
jgi:hypothetical protein